MSNTAAERLSVLETKVDDLSEKFTSIEIKVDRVLDVINKGNFDGRITKLEQGTSGWGKWLLPVLFTVIGAVITFLVIDFLKSPGI